MVNVDERFENHRFSWHGSRDASNTNERIFDGGEELWDVVWSCFGNFSVAAFKEEDKHLDVVIANRVRDKSSVAAILSVVAKEGRERWEVKDGVSRDD